jgi:hypothetical protein
LLVLLLLLSYQILTSINKLAYLLYQTNTFFFIGILSSKILAMSKLTLDLGVIA